MRIGLASLALLALLALARLALRTASSAPLDGGRSEIGKTSAEPSRSVVPEWTASVPSSNPTSEPASDRSTRKLLPEAGLFGVVLDYEGVPIHGVQVKLLAVGRPERDRIVTRVDDAGRFCFRGVEGEFDVSVWNWLELTQRVELGNGRHVEVELRATEPCVLLEGCLRRGGESVDSRVVFVRGEDSRGRVDHKDITDGSGWFRHLVRPGHYELVVARPSSELGFRPNAPRDPSFRASPPKRRDDFELFERPTRVRRDIQLPAAGIRVQVVSASDGKARAGISVFVGDSSDAHLRNLATGVDGWIEFDELEDGAWFVSIQHPYVAAQPPREVIATRPPAALTFAIAPAGSVELLVSGWSVRDAHAKGLPTLLSIVSGTGFPGALRLERYGRARNICFSSLPPGRYELRSQDIELDQSVNFAAFEPASTELIEVMADTNTELSMPLRLRPRLVIETKDDAGRPVEAQIEVFASAKAVVPHECDAQSWTSRLPAGDYRIVVRCSKGSREDVVRVADDDVSRVITID